MSRNCLQLMVLVFRTLNRPHYSVLKNCHHSWASFISPGCIMPGQHGELKFNRTRIPFGLISGQSQPFEKRRWRRHRLQENTASFHLREWHQPASRSVACALLLLVEQGSQNFGEKIRSSVFIRFAIAQCVPKVMSCKAVQCRHGISCMQCEDLHLAWVKDPWRL